MTQQEISLTNPVHQVTWRWRDLLWIVFGIFGVGKGYGCWFRRDAEGI